MKKINLFIILLAISLFSLPGRAGALNMAVTVHIAGIKNPQRGLSIIQTYLTQSPNLDFFLYGNGSAIAYLTVWQDANPVSGSAADLRNYAGPSGYAASSTTSFTIGTGSKTFILLSAPVTKYEAGTSTARIASRADPRNWMEGPVTGYAGTSLTVNVTSYSGSGTRNDWDISLAPVLLTPQTASNTFKTSSTFGNIAAGNHLMGDVYNSQGNLIWTGDTLSLNFNYSTRHTYSAYINLNASCGNIGPKADCTFPSIIAGNRACYWPEVRVTNPGLTASATTWRQANCSTGACKGSGCASDYTLYLGQNTITYPTDDTNFYIFLQQIYP